MRRSFFILIVAAGLQPSLCLAQRKDTIPVEASSEAKRRAEEEAMRRAEAEAMQKRKAEEEARRKAALEKSKAKSSNAGAGFQLLKIPVAGVYYLGMRQHEYDSLAGQNPLSITTDQKKYDLQPSPYFYAGRMYMLSLSPPDSIFSDNLPDITSYYVNKLGPPDEQQISDSVMVFPSEEDPSLAGAYRVQQATISWHYNFHDIVISFRLTDMKNGQWKGFYLVRYTGTVEYVKGLLRLEEKEKSKLTGF